MPGQAGQGRSIKVECEVWDRALYLCFMREMIFRQGTSRQTTWLTWHDLDPEPSSSFLATVLFSLKSLLEGRLQSRNLELSCNFISIQCSKLNLLIQFLLSAAAMLFHNDCPAASNTIFTDKLKIKCYHWSPWLIWNEFRDCLTYSTTALLL